MDKRFNQSRSLFATDRVPPTIFGIPVVSRKEDYTRADLEFFRRHPEAGGYYDTGNETPDDGSPEGAPVQDDTPAFTTGAKSGLQFSADFESKPKRIVKNGKVYYEPTPDGRGKFDIGGYRSYWSDRIGDLVEHNNNGLTPERAYVEGKRRTDAYFDTVAGRLYGKYGVTVGRGSGIDTGARDIIFATGGNSLLNESPKLYDMYTKLKDKEKMAPNDAFGIALVLEQDTYGWQNDRRFAARGGIIMDDLAKSEDPKVVRFVDAYRRGWSGAEGIRSRNGDAYGTNWERHKAGMREAAKVADSMNLDYSAKGKK